MKLPKITLKNIDIHVNNNVALHGDFYINDDKLNKKPLVLFVHGFKGFKNWGGFPYMLNRLSSSGYAAACFNFSHNGVTIDKPEEFTRLDLFALNTFSRELNEIGIIIDHFYENEKKYNIDKEKIILIGHSRGGGISIIAAAKDKRVKCLVTLASVSQFDRYSDKLKHEWKEKGYIEVENSRTKQIMRLNATLLKDIETNIETLNILSAASKLTIPALFIHGKEDLAVRFKESEEIYEKSNKNISELILIENTGHTFGVTHPFGGTTPAFERVIEKIKSFLESHS